MRFKDVIGNADTLAALRGMVDADRIPHAIMFHENDGGGAFRIAMAFLQYLYCHDRQEGDSCASCPSCNRITKLIHPDIHFVFPVSTGSKVSDHPSSLSYLQWFRELACANPYFTENQLTEALGIEGKSSLIAVEEAKTIIEKLSVSSLEGGYKAVVVYLPEKMNETTANRLLKSIEEPPEMTQFIFITHAPERVLRTISSRCMSVRILPPEPSEGFAGEAPAFGGSPEAVVLEAFLEALASRNLGAALAATDGLAELPSRENLKNFCIIASDALRKIFLLQQGLEGISGIPASEEELLRRLAIVSRKNFARLSLPLLDKAGYYVTRSVSPRILFTDLACKMFQLV